MSGKSAFIFDTNFIIENINLKEVVENLCENFIVYVTQVSIDERISQKYIELKKKYDKLSNLNNEFRAIANIEIKKTLDTRFTEEKEITQRGYNVLFGNAIIPFLKDEKTFSSIINRLHKKLPPFLSVDGASDKGFKDSLMWISILNYFVDNGEENVIFVTNDKGFRNSAEFLCEEFHTVTGKKIEIKDNSYYKTFLEKDNIVTEPPKAIALPDVNQLRDQIYEVIVSLCDVEGEDYWGLPEWNRTFTINQKVDSSYMEVVFEGLHKDISKHLFDQSVPAYEIFALDDRLSSGVPIPIQSIEKALKLYQDIKKNFPDYVEQFYFAAANIVNQNYIAPVVKVDSDDDCPF